MRTADLDVTIATLNSAKTIARCLQHIQENLPHHNIIVVDGGSKDTTIEICNSFNAKVIETDLLLGPTRFMQAKHSTTKWIVYVDSDVYLGPRWWPRIKEELGESVGVVNTRCRVKCSYPEYHRFFVHEWNRRTPKISVSFSNTVTRRRTVLDCPQLKHIHAGEDAIFFNHVRKQGLKIKTVPGYFAYHDRDIYLHHPSAYYRMGISSAVSNLRLIRLYLRKNMQWLKYTRDKGRFNLRLLLYLNKLAVNRAAGTLCSRF